MSIDLHMHSTVSDGTDDPARILEKVKGAGIHLFSLTDHDATAGSHELQRLLAKEESPVFIPGVEFSCRDKKGSGGRVHMLVYGYGPGENAVEELVREAHAIRMDKLEKRLDGLKEVWGFTFTDEEKDALRALNNPGKPHIAGLMVRKGYAPDRKTAIDHYMEAVRVKARSIEPEEVIKAARESGGLAVLAHGVFGGGSDKLSEDQLRDRIGRLAAAGMAGLECFYSGYGPEHQKMMLEFCREFGLCATAGSDYHGKNKNIKLGENAFRKDGPGEDLVRDFLERDEIAGWLNRKK